ncbi:hypothetical protein V6Z90_001588 [Aspergillus fumigatus]
MLSSRKSLFIRTNSSPSVGGIREAWGDLGTGIVVYGRRDRFSKFIFNSIERDICRCRTARIVLRSQAADAWLLSDDLRLSTVLELACAGRRRRASQ